MVIVCSLRVRDELAHAPRLIEAADAADVSAYVAAVAGRFAAAGLGVRLLSGGTVEEVATTLSPTLALSPKPQPSPQMTMTSYP